MKSASQTPPSYDTTRTEYVRAELDDYVDVTITCFDQQLADGHTPGFRSSDGNCRPILLSHVTEQGPAVVGIAALLDAGEGFRMPEFGVISTVSGGLKTQHDEDAVSLFELGSST